MTKKNLQSEKTKHDILRSAISLFAKKGFHNSSINQIAEAADLSIGALYWHFDNKEEILFQAIEEIRQEWRDVIRRELKREWKARQKLDKILDLFAEVTLESKEKKEKYVTFIVLIAEFTEAQERFEGHIRKVLDELYEFIAQIIDQGKEEGSFRPDLDSWLMSIAFLGSWQGILLQWIFNRNEVQLRSLVEALRLVIFDGLSPSTALPLEESEEGAPVKKETILPGLADQTDNPQRKDIPWGSGRQPVRCLWDSESIDSEVKSKTKEEKVMTEVPQSLQKIRELSEGFPKAKAILDWKEAGKQVAGWVCTYAPEEVMMAAGMLPIRVTGIAREMELEQANAYLYVNNCSFARTCMELALQKEYEYLDGFVAGATCDGSRRLYDVWKVYIQTPFQHILSVPRKFTEDAHQLYFQEVQEYKDALEEFTGKKITDDALVEAAKVCNRTRELLHRLYETRRADNPPVSGSEVLEITNASYRLPKPIFNELLEQLLKEVEGRNPLPGDRLRIMINGSVLNNHNFIANIERSGAVVVADELCTGTRYFWRLVEFDDSRSPLENIARRYLNNTPCARMDPWDVRLEHVMNMVKEYRVQGMVNEIIRYCVPYAHDEPLLRDRLEKAGIPVLELDLEYGAGDMGQIRTRVEAFLEMLRTEVEKKS